MGEAEPGLAAPFEAVEQMSVARTSTLKDRIAAAFDDTESRWWHLVNRFVFLTFGLMRPTMDDRRTTDTVWGTEIKSPVVRAATRGQGQ